MKKRHRLYDLAQDPGEKDDLTSQKPAQLDGLVQALNQEVARQSSKPFEQMKLASGSGITRQLTKPVARLDGLEWFVRRLDTPQHNGHNMLLIRNWFRPSPSPRTIRLRLRFSTTRTDQATMYIDHQGSPHPPREGRRARRCAPFEISQAEGLTHGQGEFILEV